MVLRLRKGGMRLWIDAHALAAVEYTIYLGIATTRCMGLLIGT